MPRYSISRALEASVDFPEEGYHFVDPGALAQSIDAIVLRTAMLLARARRGRLVREGLQLAIIGRPNVGKSSLFNALIGTSRAIVTDVPGTTRDLVTEIVDLDGLRVTLVDTAGIRDTEDVVETEGVARTKQAADVSDLILLVSDGSQTRETEDLNGISQSVDNKCLIVVNKSDLPLAWSRHDAISVSAKTGLGIELLRRKIVEALDIDLAADRPEITNVRHIELVRRAHEALIRARSAALADGRSCRRNLCRRIFGGATPKRSREVSTMCSRTSSKDSVLEK